MIIQLSLSMHVVPCPCVLIDVHLSPTISPKSFVYKVLSSCAQWEKLELWDKISLQQIFSSAIFLSNFRQYLDFLTFSFYIKKESRCPPYWIDLRIRDKAQQEYRRQQMLNESLYYYLCKIKFYMLSFLNYFLKSDRLLC